MIKNSIMKRKLDGPRKLRYYINHSLKIISNSYHKMPYELYRLWCNPRTTPAPQLCVLQQNLAALDNANGFKMEKSRLGNFGPHLVNLLRWETVRRIKSCSERKVITGVIGLWTNTRLCDLSIDNLRINL